MKAAALHTCLLYSTATTGTSQNPNHMLLTGTPLPLPPTIQPGHALRPQL